MIPFSERAAECPTMLAVKCSGAPVPLVPPAPRVLVVGAERDIQRDRRTGAAICSATDARERLGHGSAMGAALKEWVCGWNVG